RTEKDEARQNTPNWMCSPQLKPCPLSSPANAGPDRKNRPDYKKKTFAVVNWSPGKREGDQWEEEGSQEELILAKGQSAWGERSGCRRCYLGVGISSGPTESRPHSPPSKDQPWEGS